ncbi:MAG: SMC family ATPase [Candidatus Thermoplasmatota archaeon]
MILKTLTLKNFRKFRNTTVEFPDGVTGIVGLNGVGKSTLFEAVAWALYGPVAARTSADEIKRESAPDSEPCRVELEFTFEEDDYRVVREMTGKNLTPSASATLNGKHVTDGAEPVAEFVQKKLGLDFKSFFTSIFAKQKELNTLSSMNASERRPLVLRMLGIDSLDEVIKEIRSDKRNKEKIVEKLEHELLDENQEPKIDKLKQKIENLQEKKKEVVDSKKETEKQIKSMEKDIEEQKKVFEKKKKKYETLDEKKDKLEEQKTQFDKKQKLQEQLQKLKDKTKKRQKKLDELKPEIKKFGEIEKSLEETENKTKKIDEEKEQKVKQIEQKNTMLDRLKKDIDEIDYKTKKIKQLGPDAKCPTCDRKLSDHYDTLLNKFQKEKEENEQKIDDLSEKIQKLKEQKEKINRKYGALKKKQNYLQKQLREKQKMETTIENLTKELNEETNEKEEVEEKLEEIKEIKFDEKKYGEIKKQIKNVYQEYKESLQVLNEKKEKLGETKIKLEKKQSNLKVIENDIGNLKEKIEELKEFKEKLKSNKKEIQQLSMLSEIMSSFRTNLISRIRPTLSSYASDFFTRLTDGKYTELELDEKYNLLIYDNGEKYGIERFSGGEEDLANLCLRLAISEVITERAGGVFNFIILDEIFGSQDNIRRKNIMEALAALSSKFRQIFLITHIEDVKNDMENLLYISEREDGISQVEIE